MFETEALEIMTLIDDNVAPSYYSDERFVWAREENRSIAQSVSWDIRYALKNGVDLNPICIY